MSEYYIIETTTLKTGKVRQRSYDRKEQALEAWDGAVSGALPGERVRLLDIDSGRIMSEYTPADRRRSRDYDTE